MEQPRLPGQRYFSNKGLAFRLSRDRVGLEGMRSLARSRYPVTPQSSHPLKVPLPQKVELGLELRLWTQVPISFLLPLLILRQCQAVRGGWSCSLGHPRRSCAHWFRVPAWDHLSPVDELHTKSSHSCSCPGRPGTCPCGSDYDSFPRACCLALTKVLVLRLLEGGNLFYH